MIIWSYDHRIICSFDHRIIWTYTWSYDHENIWQYDHMIQWSYDNMIIWSYMIIWSLFHIIFNYLTLAPAWGPIGLHWNIGWRWRSSRSEDRFLRRLRRCSITDTTMEAYCNQCECLCHMITWSYDHMIMGLYDHMIILSCDHRIIWSCDHMVIWPYDNMIIWW